MAQTWETARPAPSLPRFAYSRYAVLPSSSRKVSRGSIEEAPLKGKAKRSIRYCAEVICAVAESVVEFGVLSVEQSMQGLHLSIDGISRSPAIAIYEISVQFFHPRPL